MNIIYFIEKNNLIQIKKTNCDENIKNIINIFLKDKYTSHQIIYTEKTKKEITNDNINYKDGLYSFSNGSIYEKKINVSVGYIWNDQSANMVKLGKILIVPFISNDLLFSKINIDDLKTELSSQLFELFKILEKESSTIKEKLSILHFIIGVCTINPNFLKKNKKTEEFIYELLLNLHMRLDNDFKEYKDFLNTEKYLMELFQDRMKNEPLNN